MTNKEIIKWLQSLKLEVGKQSNRHLWNYEEALNVAIKALLSTESKTGEWNRLSHDTFHCNSCGHTFIVMQGDDAMNYCPNCGSYNGGEKE